MNEKYDLIETAKRAGNFRVFVQALEAAGLEDILKETGPYTVFAPIDDAFVKVPKAKLESWFRTENRDSLRSMLTNLIISEKLPSADLKRRDEIRSMKGEKLNIESRAGLWVNEGQVINPDLEASNGVIHGIDAVLMPQTQVASAG
jgi:uncharacterized surface protein with fasciclin (FAS1) repeats